MAWASRRRRLALLLAVVVAVSLTGCQDGEAPAPDAGPSLVEPSAAPTLHVEPVTTSGRTVGRLPRTTRLRAERAVAGVAVRWLDAAYLGGSYPRRNFRKAFPGFTPGARNAARRDSRLMSNRGLGRRITAVTPTEIRVRVDLLAVRKRPVSGTAHVRVRFRTEGRVERAHRITGRLMMTWHRKGWQVFAYDVARSQGQHKQKQQQQQKQKKRKKHKDGGRR